MCFFLSVSHNCHFLIICTLTVYIPETSTEFRILDQHLSSKGINYVMIKMKLCVCVCVCLCACVCVVKNNEDDDKYFSNTLKILW